MPVGVSMKSLPKPPFTTEDIVKVYLTTLIVPQATYPGMQDVYGSDRDFLSR